MTTLADGEMAACRVEREELLIINVHGEFYALNNLCTHAGRPLSGGTLRGYELTCPGHGARFDVRTGAVVGKPAEASLKKYPVTVMSGKINVTV